MMTAVWVAVVAAAAAWVVGVSVAVYAMVKATRLISESSAAVAGLRERGNLLIDRANAAVDRAGEQITKTSAVTASMDDVTATMTELGDSLGELAPAARTLADSIGTPLTWLAALAYGLNRAVGLRLLARSRTVRHRGQAAVTSGRAALTGRSDGIAP